MIKCIATDMDGTLLNSRQKISEENKQAILKAQAQGIEVVVATGRSYQEARFVLKEAELNCPVIGVNGAEVRSIEGEVISATPIDKSSARMAAEKLTEKDIYFEVYTDKGTFTTDFQKAVSTLVDIVVSANPEVDREKIAAAAEVRVSEGLVYEIEDYEQLFTNPDHQIYKLLAFSVDSDRRQAAARSLEELANLTISSSGFDNIEITHKQAQKGIALEQFVHSRGIELSETMAIGDNYNDISMLERVGRAVAMGNAGFEIKSMCDVITDTNDENGVGKAILEVL
jgi:Cof subfamily protein (haloacid dehalogenase superfamily)